jgi:hypothetical protein
MIFIIILFPIVGIISFVAFRKNFSELTSFQKLSLVLIWICCLLGLLYIGLVYFLLATRGSVM